MTRRTLLTGAATFAAAIAQAQARKLKVIVAGGHPAAKAARQFRPDVPSTQRPPDEPSDHRVSPASCVNITATDTRKRAACYAHAACVSLLP